MEMTYDVTLPSKQAAAGGGLPLRNFWTTPGGSGGYTEQPSTSMVPGDFNYDRVVNNDDIVKLYDVIFGNLDENRLFDLNDDGDYDVDDIKLWVQSLYETLLGDATLDGTVDADDLNELGIHWQVNGELYWDDGNFDGDMDVDAGDLNKIGTNWLLTSNKH